MQRCPRGSRRNKVTGNCDPNNQGPTATSQTKSRRSKVTPTVKPLTRRRRTAFDAYWFPSPTDDLEDPPMTTVLTLEQHNQLQREKAFDKLTRVIIKGVVYYYPMSYNFVPQRYLDDPDDLEDPPMIPTVLTLEQHNQLQREKAFDKLTRVIIKGVVYYYPMSFIFVPQRYLGGRTRKSRSHV